MYDDQSIPDRKHVVSTQNRSHNGHDLVEVAEQVPGAEPTDAETHLSDGPTYDTTFWRCRQCGQERTHWSGFVDRCEARRAKPPLADGGFFDPGRVPHRILKRAQYEALVFSWLDGDVQVRNESHADPDNHEYVVRVEGGEPVACTCPADTQYDYPCKHRVALAIRRPVLEFVVRSGRLSGRRRQLQ